VSERYALAAIRPLVSHHRVQGRNLMITFTCPSSGKHVQARYTGPQSSGVTSMVARQAKSSLAYEVRRQVLSLIRSLFGSSSAMGRVATSVASTALTSATMPSTSSGPQGLSPAQVEQGFVEAFQGVSGQFAWVGERWVHSTAAGALRGPMDQQLAASPVSSRYDQLVLARMMVEVAAVHDGISPEEETHLADAIDPEWGSLEALVARPPLTRAELSQVSPGGGRATMLAAVWALALADEHEAGAERELLAGFAESLGVDADVARTTAQAFVIDQAVERAFAFGGHDRSARAALVELGARIGLTRDEVEVAEARYQRRMLG
jgi:hypothetical protein